MLRWGIRSVQNLVKSWTSGFGGVKVPQTWPPRIDGRHSRDEAIIGGTFRDASTAARYPPLDCLASCLEVASQIHAFIQVSYLVPIPVEQERVATAQLANASLGGLRPPWVADLRIDVGIEAVLSRTGVHPQ
jgi:hypothetical protein